VNIRGSAADRRLSPTKASNGRQKRGGFFEVFYLHSNWFGKCYRASGFFAAAYAGTLRLSNKLK
jgi:hypothetical protein